MPSVMAVLVTYFPDDVALRALVSSLQSQVRAITIVDNTPGGSSLVRELSVSANNPSIETAVIALGENRGVAAAINVGIAQALHDDFDYVLLCDQDSLPSIGMVSALCEVAENLKARGCRVACVSPEYVDQTTGLVAQFEVQTSGKLFYSKVHGEAARPWIEIAMSITSGSLVPCSIFPNVGMMRSDFFIDHVDTEWCHRVRHLGYSLYGTSLARLNHRLGDDSFKVWSFGWHVYTGYPPSRIYYRFRNFIAMLRLKHVSLGWKMRQSWYWFGSAYAYAIFSPRRNRNFRMILKGVWDGLRSRLGPLQ